MEQLRTNVDVIDGQIRSLQAERLVLEQRVTEGAILSPQTGVVLMVPVARGSVINPGEAVAVIGGGGLFLRLALPERHAEPLETIVKGIGDVEHVYSDTRDDRVMVTARFEVGVSSDTAILRVRDKILANMDRIPVGIPEPLVVGRGIDDVAIVALTFAPEVGQEGIGADTLTSIAREVEVELVRIEDVGLTYLVGETDQMLRIAPNPERLALHGITLQQLAAKVEGANRSMPAGNLRDGGEQIGLVIGQTLSTPGEIGNLELTARDGRTIYVRDVADVAFVSDMSEAHVATLSRGDDLLILCCGDDHAVADVEICQPCHHCPCGGGQGASGRRNGAVLCDHRAPYA